MRHRWALGPARRGEALAVADGGPVVAAELEVAESWLARAVGWIGRRRLPPERALWLPGARAVHTFGMRLAIDVGFLAADGRVLGVRRRLAPWRIALGPSGTVACVECAPGTFARTGVRPGVRLLRRPRLADARA